MKNEKNGLIKQDVKCNFIFNHRQIMQKKKIFIIKNIKQFSCNK